VRATHCWFSTPSIMCAPPCHAHLLCNHLSPHINTNLTGVHACPLYADLRGRYEVCNGTPACQTCILMSSLTSRMQDGSAPLSTMLAVSYKLFRFINRSLNLTAHNVVDVYIHRMPQYGGLSVGLETLPPLAQGTQLQYLTHMSSWQQCGYI
jgi:hypothetical protein